MLLRAWNWITDWEAPEQSELRDYARKSYRYLRISIVTVVTALVLGIVFHRIDEGQLLPAISSYQWSEVSPLFVGTLIMTGVGLIAIRGASDFEDTVLNLAGMLAPLVALVPTGCPKDRRYEDIVACEWDPTAKRLVPLFDIQVSLFTPNVGAAALAGLLAFFVYLLIHYGNERGKEHPQGLRQLRAVLPPNTKRGLLLAALLVIAMTIVEWRTDKTHFIAAAGLILGLWLVTTGNAVRHVQPKPAKPGAIPEDEDERKRFELRRQRGAAWKTGAVGSIFVAGLALVGAGIWRELDDTASFGWPLVVLGLVVMAAIRGYGPWKGWLDRFRSVVSDGDRFCAWYLLVSVVMTIGAVVLGLAPEFRTKTFWLEMVLLVPFGFFWLLQTIEYWDTGHRSAAPTRTSETPSTPSPA